MAKIFCPKCRWKPRPHDLWGCEPGCQFSWHTFDTRGQCPRCGKQWKQTQCLRCHRWSLHESWYHDDGSDERLERLLQDEPAPLEAQTVEEQSVPRVEK